MIDHLSWLIPLIVSTVGALGVIIIGVIIWAVRLESKILFIESEIKKDRDELKEALHSIFKILEEMRTAAARQYTRTAVLESKIKGIGNE